MDTNELLAPTVAEKDATVIFAIKMPKSMREDFKRVCAQHNLDMSVVLRRFMQKMIDEHFAKE